MATPPVPEQQKAALSQVRGRTAAALAKQGHFASPSEQQKFISAQGDAEAAGKLDQPKMEQLRAQGQTALAGFKKGGKVPADGVYKLHKDEVVIPAEKSKGRGSEYRKVYMARRQTRQGGGNTPVKGEKHDQKKA